MMIELWVLAVGAAIAGLVQGISGFAFAMVAMSIWVWAIDPQVAAVMAVFGGWTGQVIPRSGSAADGTSRSCGLLCWGAPWASPSAPGCCRCSTPIFKLVLGSLLVVCCSAMLATSRLPHVERGGRWADAFVGLLGGVMAPLSGFSGLAPALWCTLRGYNKDAHRAVLQNFNLLVLSATLASNVWAGRVRPDMLPRMGLVAATLVVPAV